jgi:hypothetical protein
MLAWRQPDIQAEWDWNLQAAWRPPEIDVVLH